MKRFLTWLLVATILLSFTACGNDDKKATNTCWNCGETISENAAYCASCGSAIADKPNHTESPTSGTESTINTTDNTQDATEDTTVGNTTETTEPPTTPPTACSHSWSAATCTAPKTCSKCGATEGSVAGHSWSAATCTAPKTCSKCGATEGSVAGHSWSAATCTAPKTCSTCGATEGSVAGHSWSAATCTAPKTCSKCGAIEGNAAGHSWNAATCTTPKTCSKCGATEGNAAGHSYSKTVTNATCTAQGYTTYTCSCGDTYQADYTNPKHRFNEYYTCSHCGIVDSANAYNYLVKMVQVRGSAYATKIDFDIFGDGSVYLAYDGAADYLYIYCSDYTDDVFSYTSINLKSFFYGCTTDDTVEITGYLNANKFTSNSPLTDVHYTGPSNGRGWYIEYARLSVTSLLEALKCITDQTEGLSMADLGFKAY